MALNLLDSVSAHLSGVYFKMRPFPLGAFLGEQAGGCSALRRLPGSTTPLH